MDDHSQSNTQYLAITAALEGRFEDALKLNKKIIKFDEQNVEALVRLGRAYMELGKLTLAKRYYNQALKYDPYNPIALKNLKIIKTVKPNGTINPTNGYGKLTSSLFLQEPGKTKIVSLLKVAEPQKLSLAYCGMPVFAQIKNRKIIIASSDSSYLGVLPDDICHLLIRLMRGGNKYEFFIKSVRVNSLGVLIRETFRSKRFKNQPSFLNGVSTPHFDMIAPVEEETEEEIEEVADEEV